MESYNCRKIVFLGRDTDQFTVKAIRKCFQKLPAANKN